MVTVTMPASRVTSIVSMRRDDTDGVGLNPYRKQTRRPSDYVFVVAAIVVALALIAWALLA